MATVNTHKPCGATIIKAAAANIGQAPRYYAAQGAEAITECPNCKRPIREQQLSYVRVAVQPRPAPRESTGET